MPKYKFTGKTEADKKYDLLVRQLEHEMDEKEKQEYFGNCDACGKDKVYSKGFLFKEDLSSILENPWKFVK